jgi:hypothetical protein
VPFFAKKKQEKSIQTGLIQINAVPRNWNNEKLHETDTSQFSALFGLRTDHEIVARHTARWRSF